MGSMWMWQSVINSRSPFSVLSLAVAKVFGSLLLVQWHFRIHGPRPAVDSAAHGLNFFVSLLAEPVGNRQRPDAVMAHDHDVIVRVEFLVSPRRDVTHRNVLRPFDAGRLVFPGLANIEQRKCFSALPQRLDLAGRDFEVHSSILSRIFSLSLSVETGLAPSHWQQDAASRVSTPIRLYSCEARVHFAAWSDLSARRR